MPQRCPGFEFLTLTPNGALRLVLCKKFNHKAACLVPKMEQPYRYAQKARKMTLNTVTFTPFIKCKIHLWIVETEASEHVYEKKQKREH
jgi:hypothetical protein